MEATVIQSVWWILWILCLAFLAFEDFFRRKIRREGCLFLLLLGILWYCRYPERLAEGLSAAAWILTIGGVIHFLGRGSGLGGGDIRLAAAAAVRLGGRILPALFISLVSALAVALICRRQGQEEIPLGPFIAAGILLGTLHVV